MSRWQTGLTHWQSRRRRKLLARRLLVEVFPSPTTTQYPESYYSAKLAFIIAMVKGEIKEVVSYIGVSKRPCITSLHQ
jgi:hypothetical protein